MRRTDSAICGVLAIHLGQTPMVIDTLSIVQTSDVGKSAQQPRDNAQGVRFKIFESGFQPH